MVDLEKCLAEVTYIQIHNTMYDIFICSNKTCKLCHVFYVKLFVVVSFCEISLATPYNCVWDFQSFYVKSVCFHSASLWTVSDYNM